MNKKCSKCNTEKPKAEFSPDRRRADGLQSSCKQCDREWHKQRYDDPAHTAERSRLCAKNSKDAIKRMADRRARGLCASCSAHTAQWRCENCTAKAVARARGLRERRGVAGLCITCGEAPRLESSQQCEGCRVRRGERVSVRYRRVKDAVYEAYGGYRCACCGETEEMFLSIDHIDNRGAEHRRQIRCSLVDWLYRNNFPSGFQVLCWNCNRGKFRNGGVCPHITNPTHPVDAILSRFEMAGAIQ